MQTEAAGEYSLRQQANDNTPKRGRDPSANTGGTISPIYVGSGDWPALPPRQAPAGLAGPTIPRGIFPTWIDAWADAWSGSFQVDRSLLLGNALGAAATLTQGRAWVYAKSGEWKEGTNLFLANVANSGSLKSPAFDRAFKPVVLFEGELRAQAASTVRDAEIERDALVRELDRKKQRSKTENNAAKRKEIEAEIAADRKALDEMRIPVLPRLALPTNMTPETVVQHLAQQGGVLTIASGEDSFMPIVSGRYSDEPAIESFLDCYSNKATGSHRVDAERSFDVPGPTALSIVTSTQPSALRAFLGDERSRGRGLHARFLFLVLRTPPEAQFTLNTPPVSQKVEDTYQDRMLALGRSLRARSTQDAALSIHLGGDALSSFGAVHANLRAYASADATSADDAAFAAKSSGTILRLAALLHLLHEGPISSDVAISTVPGTTMEHAIHLFHVFAGHYAAAQAVATDGDGRDCGNYTDRVLEWASDPTRGGSFSRRELGRKFRDAKRAEVAVAELLEGGLIRERAMATTGRSAKVYDVHPGAAAYLARSVPCPWALTRAIDGRKDGSPPNPAIRHNFPSELSSAPSDCRSDVRTKVPGERDVFDPFRPSPHEGDERHGRKSAVENKPDSDTRPPSDLPSTPGRWVATDFDDL